MPIPSPLIAKSDTVEANKNGCAARTKHTVLFSCSWGDENADKTVALVGASHDTQWQTVVVSAARASGANTETYLKNACPFGNASDASRDVIAGCEQWSEQLISALLEDPPDVVVTIATSREDGRETIPDWKREYFDRLLSAGVTVIGIRDNPVLDEPGPACVESGFPERCAVASQDMFVGLDELKIPTDPDFVFVDLADVYCPGGVCSVLSGPILMYQDTAHLTETWTLEHGQVLSKTIAGALATNKRSR